MVLACVFLFPVLNDMCLEKAAQDVLVSGRLPAFQEQIDFRPKPARSEAATAYQVTTAYASLCVHA